MSRSDLLDGTPDDFGQQAGITFNAPESPCQVSNLGIENSDIVLGYFPGDETVGASPNDTLAIIDFPEATKVTHQTQ